MWPALLERWIQINSCLGSNAPDPFQPDTRKHDSNKVFLTMRRALWSHVCVFTQIIYFLRLSSGWIKGIISFGFQLSGGDISLAAAHSSPECTIEDVRVRALEGMLWAVWEGNGVWQHCWSSTSEL